TDFRGKTTTYAYDATGRLLSKTPDPSLGEPAVTYTYTPTGERRTMTDATGTTAYDYDARGRLVSKATPHGTLSYTYDAAGNLLTLRSSNTGGVSVDYSYDALNRLSSLTDNRLAAGTTVYTYDPNGNLESVAYPNGVKSAYTYNSLNRLTNLTAAGASSTVAGYAYTLGPAGNRLSVAEHDGRTVEYAYDALYRLTGEAVSNDAAAVNGSIGYAYDAVGNRLARTSTVANLPAQQNLTYDANDRPTSEAHDQNGNVTQSQGATYAYDSEDQLTEVNGGAVRFLYDGDGNRVARTAGGVTTRYLVDTNNHTGHAQVVEELVGGVVRRQYTYGHSLVSQRQLVGGEWRVSFYGYDGHGSVRYLTDAAGAVTDTYTYDAFGNLLARTGATPNDRLYAGERFDAEVGLYHLRARDMNPASGRFLTMDLLAGSTSDPQTLHKYLYALNDPTNKLDPSGLQANATAQLVTVSVLNVLVAFSAFLFLSYRVWHNLPEGAFSERSDAFILGYGRSVSMANRSFAWPWLRAALMLTQVSGGIEILIPRPINWEFWLYGYLGPGVTFELPRFRRPLGGTTHTGYVGWAWGLKDASGLPNATNYQGVFICTGAATKQVPVRIRVSLPFQLGLQLCSSRTQDDTPGSYSFTGDVLGTASSWTLAASVLWYTPPIVLDHTSVTFFPGGLPVTDNLRALWHSLVSW
ncbi:MAG: hypothetical protein M3416_04615, partial [Acidobacteriota bacterium]|nr:hypothetical protein [Acidobacteriota bacterium]